MLVPGAVADDTASELRGQLRREIAYLVGMRHEHQLRLLLGDEMLERGGERIRRVALQRRRIHRVDLCQLFPRDLSSERSNPATHYSGFHCPAHVRGDRLPGRDRLPGNPVQLALLLLDNHKYGWHEFLTPGCSLLTSGRQLLCRGFTRNSAAENMRLIVLEQSFGIFICVDLRESAAKK